MDAYRAIIDKRDQRVYLPKPIPGEGYTAVITIERGQHRAKLV